MINKNLLLLVIIVTLINFISFYNFFRKDLTDDKKHSISNASKKLLNELDDIVYFKVFLHGDIPIEYQSLQREIKYMLDEFRMYSKYIEYDFIDPSAVQNEEYQMQMYESLYQKGIQPIPHRKYENNKVEETWIFPGITTIYRNKEYSASIINNAVSNNIDITINNSINKIENILTKCLRQVTINKKPKIGFINGHGEMVNQSIISFKNEISEYYDIADVTINGQLIALDNLDCIIINHPTKYFSEKDKFIIDQFIMKGGKSIWIMNGTNASIDSLELKGESMALPLTEINLHDMMFNYGLRVNMDIVQDLQCDQIPIVTHIIQDQPQITLFPWTFFPIISPNDSHIITKKIDPVRCQFPSSIDTLSNKLIKTVLLQTSNNTKINNTPALISLENIDIQPNAKQFNSRNLITSVLLEGEFKSVFSNRSHIIETDTKIDVQTISNPNKMIVISDGQFIRNQFHKNKALPLGFDRNTGKIYGNNEFILNCIDYLMDNTAYIQIRSKNISMRLLNKSKMKNEKIFWKLFNLIGPILLISFFVFFMVLRRKKKYSKA